MTEQQVKKIILNERPKGMPNDQTFQFVSDKMPAPIHGEVFLKTIYVSVDPYMRGRMSNQKSYVAPFEVGKAISGGVISEVLESNSASFKKGDIVLGNLDWSTYQTVHEDQIRQVDPSLAPVSAYLGALGMTGLTAYFGLLDIGQPQPGETVVVSGAAGAVGSLVGQIAKLKGARAVGIAGSEEKCQYLINELGFDAAVNYKDSHFNENLKSACANGVDVYFDNVGGTVSDAVLKLINHGARIPVCGQISLYNLEKADHGPRIQSQILVNSALMKGFIVSDYAKRFEEGMKDLGEWLQDGKITYKETVEEGFENIPDAFLGLFEGKNIGKYLVKVAEPEKQ